MYPCGSFVSVIYISYNLGTNDLPDIMRAVL